MEPVKNIIRKQSLHFTYNARADALTLKDEVQNWCAFQLLPEIEKRLENLTSPDEYIIIDKLNLEANIDKRDWKDQLKFAIIQQFSEKIKYARALRSPNNEKAISVIRRTDDLVLFYLNNGYLPWWSPVLITTDFETVFEKWAREPISVTRQHLLISELRLISVEKLRIRLLDKLAEKIFYQLMQNLFPAVRIRQEEIRKFVKAVLSTVASARKLEVQKNFRYFLFNSILQEASLNEEFLLQFLHSSVIKYLDAGGKADFFDKVRKHKGLQNLLHIWQQITKADYEAPNKRQRKASANLPDANSERVAEKLPQAVPTLNEENEEGIYIENAGAVIIAAFLPALFTKLKLTDGKSLFKPELAVSVIQFAVSGSANMDETQLVLPKILCGLDLDMPIEIKKRMTPVQKKEIEELLSSVVEHWSVLKNTSVQGLRETFLQRAGTIKFSNNNEWQLKVEEKAFDMLLKRLPWNIGMIRLPWMKQVLITEWV